MHTFTKNIASFAFSNLNCKVICLEIFCLAHLNKGRKNLSITKFHSEISIHLKNFLKI